jgi:hypothetical protein
MGSPVGVFTDEEVKELTINEKRLLKEYIIQYIVTSAEIRRVISDNPKLLTRNAKIRKVLRRKAGKLHRRLKKK